MPELVTAMPQSLPADVLLLIIDAHDASPWGAPVALPPSHPTTKSLLALSLVCRVAYPAALRMLFARCLYLDSAARLSALLYCLRQLDTRVKGAGESDPRLPAVRVLDRLRSLYISPFPSDTINVSSVAADVQQLFALLAPSLRTLVIDMPLRSLYPEDDHARVRPILREAFAQLTQLESFCSVRDELYLSCRPFGSVEADDEPPVWSLWPHLQILALYNLDLGSDCWSYLGRLSHLQTLVATRADGLHEVDLQETWRLCSSTARTLRIFLVNTWQDHIPPRGSTTWEPDDRVTVHEISVPISYYGDEDPITACQNWEKAVALRNELSLQRGKRLLRSRQAPQD